MAKKFFYVCGGILMLALSYHFGAVSSQASSSGAIIDTGLPFYCGNASSCAAAVVGRQLYANGAPSGPPIPGTGRVSWMGQGTGNNIAVMLDNGDTYWQTQASGNWVYAGNAVGATTSARRQTWGAEKARYR